MYLILENLIKTLWRENVKFIKAVARKNRSDLSKPEIREAPACNNGWKILNKIRRIVFNSMKKLRDNLIDKVKDFIIERKDTLIGWESRIYAFIHSSRRKITFLSRATRYYIETRSECLLDNLERAFWKLNNCVVGLTDLLFGCLAKSLRFKRMSRSKNRKHTMLVPAKEVKIRVQVRENSQKNLKPPSRRTLRYA
jgi:hypothetical protein